MFYFRQDKDKEIVEKWRDNTFICMLLIRPYGKIQLHASEITMSRNFVHEYIQLAL